MFTLGFILSLSLYDVKDIVFCNAVEDFVVAASPKSCVPDDIKRISIKLSNQYYKVRNKYRIILSNRVINNPKELSYLFDIIKTTKDNTVKSICFGIIKKFSRCKNCHGTGMSNKFSEYPCWICDGSGYSWKYITNEG